MVNQCSIEGCERTQKYLKRTWCNSHYEAWRRHGHPTDYTRNWGRGKKRVVNGPTKKCKTCGEVKDTEKDFYKNNKGWVYVHCKKCHNKKTMAIYLKNKLQKPPKEKREPEQCAFPDCRNTDEAGRILKPGAPEGRFCGAHHQQWASKQELTPLRRHNRVFKNDNFKQCTVCFEVKPVESYHLRTKGTRQSVCKKCASTMARMHLLRRQGRFDDALEKAQSLPESVREMYVTQIANAIAEAENG